MRPKQKNKQFIEELENLIEQYKEDDEMSMHTFTDQLKKTKHRYAATETAIEERQKIAKIGKKLCNRAGDSKRRRKRKRNS